MTINKISRSGSSVVTLAELQSGSAVFVQKVGRISTAGPVITGGLVSQADIIKRGVQVQTIVGRALANPYGSVFNFFDRLGLSDETILLLARQVALADQFFITHNTPQFLLNKGLSDSEPILERISLRIAAFRVFEDAQFVSTATKFTLTRPLVDSQSLIDTTRISAGYQRAAADIQTIVDTRLALTIGKTNRDTVTQSDSTAKQINALKQDQAIPTEDQALTVGKGLFDGVRIRNRDDPGPVLFVTKLLRDTTTILDLTGVFDGLTYQNIMYRFETIFMSDNFSRTIAANRRFNESQSIIENILLQRGFSYQDAATPADNKQLAITVQRSDATVVAEALQRIFLAQRVFQDTAIMSEVRTLTAGLGKNDVASMLERIASRVIGKVNQDTITVTERIAKSSIKKLADSIVSSEAMRRLIGKGITDAQSVREAIALLLATQRVLEDAVLTATRTFYTANKVLRDTNLVIETIAKNSGKFNNSIVNPADRRPAFAIGKQFGDSTTMQDLAAVFDGITYNYGLGRLDAVQAIDNFTRTISAFRRFEDTQVISDVFFKIYTIGFPTRTDSFSLADSLTIGKLPVDTLFIGSGQDRRNDTSERISFTITRNFNTTFRTQIDTNADFFTGVQENLIGIVAGQTFAGSIMFASTSAGASVQVTNSGTGIGSNDGFLTVYGNPYISFNGAGNRTVATVPIDFTAITSVSINFAYIAGNNSNGGEQPDLNEDLVIEYSIDEGSTFVTADTILAISTYGSPSWAQYTSSLPALAKTSSTILRWRQTAQSINSGDNWGITNIQLGGTSSGIFIRTYYDNNTATMEERIGLGQDRRPSDSVRVAPDYESLIEYYEAWNQTTTGFTTNGTAPFTYRVSNAVYSQFSNYWFLSSFESNNYRCLYSENGKEGTDIRPLLASSTFEFRIGADTSGQTIILAARPISPTDDVTGPSATFVSFDGGINFVSNVSSEQVQYSRVGPQWTSKGGVTYINREGRTVGFPVYVTGRGKPTFIYGLACSSTSGTYRFMFSTSTGTTAAGVYWSAGGPFATTSIGAELDGGHIVNHGAVNGSGWTVVHLTNYSSYAALFTLHDLSSLTGSFGLSTSLAANRILHNYAAHPNLAFGNGTFVWVGANGHVSATTSPGVTASWRTYTIEPATKTFTTSTGTYGTYVDFAVYSSIAFDPVKGLFIIARNGTSTATSGFWYSSSAGQNSWIFKSAETLRVDSTYRINGGASIWPLPMAYFTTGAGTSFTSIGMSLTTFFGNPAGTETGFSNQEQGPYDPSLRNLATTRIGRLFTGSYVQPPNTSLVTINNNDKTTLQSNKFATQGVNRSFSGVTVTAQDTDRLFIGRQGITGVLISSVGTFIETTSLTVAGNIITWSEDFTTSRWTGTGVTPVANQTTAPDGTLTADKLVVNFAGSYIQQDDVKTLKAGVQYTHSVYLKGDGSSVGYICAIGNFDGGSRTGQTSLTLTENWQRLSATFTSVASSNRNIFIQPNGIAGSNMLSNQSLFAWGYQITTGSTLQAYNEYTRTTSTTIDSGGTYIADIYTTSYTFITGVGIRLSSEPLENVKFDAGKGILLDPANMADSFKSVVSTILSPARAGSAEILSIIDRPAKAVTLTAYRSVAGQVQLKTINAAGNLAQSSVLFSYGARSPDVVGTIDLIFVAIIKSTLFADAISIGGGIDQRQFNTERISFAITKANTDSISIDDRPFKTLTKVNRDTAIVIEQPIFSIALNKTEVLTASDVVTTTRGKGLVEIITVVDSVTQQISLLKVDDQTITDNRVFDLSLTKADAVTASQTLVALTVTKPVIDAFDSTDRATNAIGLGKVDALDNADRTNFDIALTAYRGVAGTVTLNTIDPSPDVEFEQSSVTVVRGARSPDEVGMLDLFSLLYIINRQLEDAVTAADQRTFFTITKTFADSFAPDDFLATFDGLTYAGFMLRQDSIDVAQRMFMNMVLGTKTESIGIADLTALVQGKPNTDSISIGTDTGFRNTNGLETTNFNINKLAGNLVVTASGTSASVGGSGNFNVGIVNRTWQIATSTAFTYGTGDFTVEWWSNQAAGNGVQGIWRNSTGDTTFSSGFLTITQNSGRLTVTQGNGAGGNLTLTSNTTLAFNTWNHYAYVKNNGTHLLYVNGTAQNNSFYWLTSNAQLAYMQIGNAGGQYSGFITNFRIVKGTAVYTSNFTPPTEPLTAIAGTQLLALFTSSGGVNVDSSPNNFTLVPTSGGPVWTSSTPFTAGSGTLTTTYSDTHPVTMLDVKTLQIGLNRLENVDALDVFRPVGSYIRKLAEVQSIDELKALSISKYNVDNIAADDVLALIYVSNKFFFELVNNEDATQFAISQFTNNSIVSSDQLAFAQSKLLADSFAETDVSRFDVSLVKADAQTLDDQRSLAISLVKSDVVTLADLASLVGSFSRSVFDDLAIVQGPVFFTITKTFADSFVPDDFLQTFDGLTYAYATSRYDEIATAQRVFMDVVLGARTDTVVSLEQILVAQLKRYEDTTTETDQLQLKIDNLINNVAIAVDVQQFSIAAVKADSLAGDERKYLDVSKLVSPDTISLADLIDIILFIPTPEQFYFDSITISDASFLSVSKRLREEITVADNKTLDVAIVAHRGVAGTVILNTIDSSPDVEFQQSSVTVSRSSMDRDEVGTLDFFSLTYSTVRSIEDFIAIADVAPKFAITKLLNDATVPDDFLQTFDGLTYATTILKQDSVSIGLPGFTGRRVSGDDRERIVLDVAIARVDEISSTDTGINLVPGKNNSDAVQNSDALALSISLSKTDVQIVEQTQRFFDISLSKTEILVSQDALRKDIDKLLGNEDILSITDLLALQAQYQLSLAEIQNILGEKDGNFSYLLDQAPKNDVLSTSDDRLASFISKDLTNLDGLNNINTMVSNGTLRMTDYADIDYFAEDYVGESRSFT